jgi:hypothetical protein
VGPRGADGRLVLACLAAAGGAVLLAAGILANSLQVGGSPEFGWKQAAACLAGALALGAGVLLADRDRARALWRARPGALRGALTVLPYAAVGGYAAYLGAKLRPSVLLDDAAITFRYVERLTSGHGFTYNDHERVLGTSNPLYTLVLTALDLLGLNVETAAEAVGLASFVGGVLLAMWIAAQLSNLAGGVAAGLLLATQDFFRYQALSGMESGFALLLGLAAVACLLRERDGWAGAFLGLAVWNKLDAGLLAVAVAGAYVLFRRRFPLRVAAVAVAVAAPWLLFALAYFGSPLPHSVNAKLGTGDPASPFDRSWVLDLFTTQYRWLPVVLGACALGFLGAMSAAQRVAATTLVGWFALHFAAFSLLDLGDPYPWYTTVLFGPPAILTGVLCGRLLGLALASRRPLAWAAMLCLPLAVALALVSTRAPVQTARADLRAGNPPEPFETFDDDRRLAGIWLDQYAGEDEVVTTCWGWTAYESRRPFNDTCELNTEKRLTGDHYLVHHGNPYVSGSVPPEGLPGYVHVATFNLASDLFPGWSWFNIYARPESRIAREGRRYLQYRLFELRAPRRVGRAPLPALEGQNLVASGAGAAAFEVRNARRPVHVVFTPVAGAESTTFALRGPDGPVYRRAAAAGAPQVPVVRAVAGAAGAESTRLVFSTTGPGTWHEVKVVVGDALVDTERIRDTYLRRSWRQRNPA